MAELRLEDIGAILVGLVVVGIGYAGLRLIYEYRVEIGLFISALWRRYIAVNDWRAAMDRLADERDGVRDYAYHQTYDTSSSDEWDGDDLPPRTAPAPSAQSSATACARAETPRTEACGPAPLNMLELSAYEQNMVRKMVDRYARSLAAGQKPSKSKIIKDVTGYSRSGDPNSRYARYSELYNLLLETPDPAVAPAHQEAVSA